MSADAAAGLRVGARSGSTGPVAPDDEPAARVAFLALKAALNAGTVRAAERGADGRWRANAWVKAGILLGFRLGRVQPAATGGPFPFYDKDTYPLRPASHRGRRPHRPRRLGRSATAATSRRASSACRRCTSTSARTSARARWWTRTRWSARAPRSAGGCTCPRRRRSAACSSPRARCRSSSRTRCWSAGTAACTRAPSCASARCSRRARSSPAARRCSTWCTTGSTAATATGRSRFPPAPSWFRAPGRCARAPARAAGIGLYAPVIVKYRDEKTDTAVRLEELLR